MIVGPNTRCLINNKWYHVNQIDTAQQIIKVQGRDGKEQLFDLKDVTVFIERHENNNNKNVIREVNRS